MAEKRSIIEMLVSISLSFGNPLKFTVREPSEEYNFPKKSSSFVFSSPDNLPEKDFSVKNFHSRMTPAVRVTCESNCNYQIHEFELGVNQVKLDQYY